MEEDIIMIKENIESLNGLFKELENNINNDSVSSREFDYVYCQIARLIAAWIEYAIKTENDFNDGYELNKGLIIGLFVRLFKILVNIDKLIYKDSMSYDIAMQLNRKTIELCAIAQYLLKYKDDEELIEKYKYKSLIGEKNFYDRVVNDMNGANDEVVFIQKRVLQSIDEKFNKLNIDKSKSVKKFPNIETVFSETGHKALYDIAYRVVSHSIHADAMSTITCDLVFKNENNKFFPKFEHNQYDLRQYNPTLKFILYALKDLIQTYEFSFDKNIFIKEEEIILYFIVKLEKLHEEYLNKKQ